MRNPEVEAAPDLREKAARMDHRSDVADAEHVYEPDAACFDVHFDLGEPDHERIGGAITWMVVLGHSHQTQTGERRRRSLRHRIDVFRDLVAVVFAAQLDGAFGSLWGGDALRGGASTIDPLSADREVVGGAAEIARSNFLHLSFRVTRPR